MHYLYAWGGVYLSSHPTPPCSCYHPLCQEGEWARAPRLLPAGASSPSSPPSPAHAHRLHLTHFGGRSLCVCLREKESAHSISPVGAFDFLCSILIAAVQWPLAASAPSVASGSEPPPPRGPWLAGRGGEGLIWASIPLPEQQDLPQFFLVPGPEPACPLHPYLLPHLDLLLPPSWPPCPPRLATQPPLF